MRKFFIPSNCSDIVIHFNFNFMVFDLVRRSPKCVLYWTANQPKTYSSLKNIFQSQKVCVDLTPLLLVITF